MASCPCLHPTTALQAGCSSVPQRFQQAGCSSLQQRKLESDADRCCGRNSRHSGGFLLRIMPPSWHPVPACAPRLRYRRAVLRCSYDGAALILKSGLEIKNRCSLWAILEGFLASIPKSGPEIKNRCTLEGVSGENLTSILKSGPEIKNRCIGGVVAFCRRNHSLSPQRKLESDADLVAATITVGGPFFTAAARTLH